MERTAAITSCATGSIEGIGLFPVLAKLIVFPTLLRIIDHLVSFVECLELCFCLWIIGMQIRMKLFCTLQICPTDILLRDVLVDAKNLVIINKCHNLILLFLISIATKNMPCSAKRA